MSAETIPIPPGRVETLDAAQEKVLKQVWMYYLHFSGYQFTPATSKPTRRNTLSSVKSMDSSQTKKSATSGTNKKAGVFGRFKRGHGKKKSIDEETQKELASRTSSDPAVKLTTDLKIHAAFKDLDPKSKHTFWQFLRHDTPDNLLLRFIRARKWDVDKSLLMISNTLKWRTDVAEVDDLLFNGELGLVLNDKMGVIRQFEIGKAIICGIDRNNRPMVIIRPRFHHASDQTEEEVELFTLLLIEYARLLITEPVDSCSVLFDLSGFTMANMDYPPVKFIIKAFEAHYPESLGVLFVHKAPWIFSGIWNIIKKWLDPVVASKIVFTKTTEDLEKVVTKENIPKELGGLKDLNWDYKIPTEHENGKLSTDETKRQALEQERTDLIDQFIAKTIEWIECQEKEKNAALLKERIELGKSLSENYKSLDGFIRNRGIYDKRGDVTFSTYKG